MASNAWVDTIKQLEKEEGHLQDAIKETAHLLPPRGAKNFVAKSVDPPLERIADIIAHMPYGDVMEMSEHCLEKDAPYTAVDAMARRLWAWAKKLD